MAETLLNKWKSALAGAWRERPGGIRVDRGDFNELYVREEDPWSIGDADSARYDLYFELIRGASARRSSILDIGCGFGAFLARFTEDFDRLIGVEISAEAIEKGTHRFPSIRYVEGSATTLDTALPDEETYDTIVYSDVIYYLKERDKRRSLRWIADHLAPGGLAFIAAWTPGRNYLTGPELRRLVENYLMIEDETVLDSGHTMLLCRPRRQLVALTVDYETWQPIPPGRKIDWDDDVFTPTAQILDACDREGATLTLMAEVGEYLWLQENEPGIAAHMEDQWRDAVRRGHDVQLHLHPAWLPELGVRRDGDSWSWETEGTGRAADYPGDLQALIARCTAALEEAIRPADPAYGVSCFRAGAYEAQPFRRLHGALAANGIVCDSSVVPGDRRPERGYDYRLACSTHQPYFASRSDPQLKAPPAEEEIVEIPIFAPKPGLRWSFDDDEGSRFADRLLSHHEAARRLPSTEAIRRRRRRRAVLSRVIPRRLASPSIRDVPERQAQHDYYVLVGHSKSDLDVSRIAHGIRKLRQEGFACVSLSEMARLAREELLRSEGGRTDDQTDREVGSQGRPSAPDRKANPVSRMLQEAIPLDRARVLDAGTGAREGDSRLAPVHPSMQVARLDPGGDLASMPFQAGEFDCVYSEGSLERVADVDAALRELHRVLSDGGILVASISAVTGRPDIARAWQTTPADVQERVSHAGFERISVREAEQMILVSAWKSPKGALDRIAELTRWAYGNLDPAREHDSKDPLEILAGGHAWCWGYARVLVEAVQREGLSARFITMVAQDHPKGRGAKRRDSHAVVEVELPDGRRVVCDPMAGRMFDASLDELLADPGRADDGSRDDERWRERRYDLYATSEWYRRVVSVAVRPRFRNLLRIPR
jgi:SAM-dependent methyltransferase